MSNLPVPGEAWPLQVPDILLPWVLAGFLCLGTFTYSLPKKLIDLLMSFQGSTGEYWGANVLENAQLQAYEQPFYQYRVVTDK
jgi:hypothetical protein